MRIYTLSGTVLTAASLMSTTAFGILCNAIVRREQDAEGLQWSNLFHRLNGCDTFSGGTAMCMLGVDAVLYLVLALYLEQVLPQEFGVQQPWYFPLQYVWSLGSRAKRWLAVRGRRMGHRGGYYAIATELADVHA